MTYKTKITTSAQVVQVSEDGTETVIYGHDRYLRVSVAERIAKDLNNGYKVVLEDYLD